METKTELTKEVVLQSIEKGSTSISGIWKSLGNTTNISSSTVKKIKTMLPDIQDRLNANKNKPTDKTGLPHEPSIPAAPVNDTVVSAKPTKATTAVKPKQPKEPKPTRKSKYPRHPKNPYRIGSNYGLAFDVLATHPKGIGRDELINLIRKENGKDVKHTLYDLSVVLSAKESPTGPRHRSAKDGYFVEKQYHHYKLVLP